MNSSKQKPSNQLKKSQDKAFQYKTPVEDQKPAQRPKTESEWRSFIDEKIQEAMDAGEFDNLPGAGKPLNLHKNPHGDPADELAHKILKDNNFAPEWIERGKEIRRDLEEAQTRLQTVWQNYQQGRSSEVAWQRAIQQFEGTLNQINRKIDDFNLIVPILSKQMLRLELVKEVEKVKRI